MVEVPNRISNVDLSKVMRTSFLDYAMSVIVARALPDVRDGFEACSPPDLIRDE